MAARRRVNGRFASEVGAGDEDEKGSTGKVPRVRLRPWQCREFARKRMAEALPEIVDRFVREAKLGSIPHAKALAGMCGMDKAEAPVKQSRRRPGLTEMLMQELKRGREANLESPSAL